MHFLHSPLSSHTWHTPCVHMHMSTLEHRNNNTEHTYMHNNNNTTTAVGGVSHIVPLFPAQ